MLKCFKFKCFILVDVPYKRFKGLKTKNKRLDTALEKEKERVDKLQKALTDLSHHAEYLSTSVFTQTLRAENLERQLAEAHEVLRRAEATLHEHKRNAMEQRKARQRNATVCFGSP